MCSNKPEISLHPQLLAPLAALIVIAAARSQLIVVSHSQPLIDAIRPTIEEGDRERPLRTVDLVEDYGETKVSGQAPLDEPAWRWPKR